MSGGSFDYLYIKDPDQLLTERDLLSRMASYLTEQGFRDAALETERLVAMLEHVERQVRARAERLSKVWKAAEWYASCDWGRDRLAEAVNEWRDIIEPPSPSSPPGESR